MMRRVAVDRFGVTSAKSFDEVLRGLEKGIGRPDMRVLKPQMDGAESLEEFERLIHAAVGSADLMDFLRLDLGAAIKKDPAAKSFRIVRIIAGNPLIMKQMVERVPDAGSYAPVTILVYENDGGVHLAYDTMSSYLNGCGDEAVLAVARSLDEKVIALLTEAAG
ncbi:DUF302 domain-containing protein [Edaphobacter modestus]|uniref:Uncharacterized protein DUF302 n=1 Tax=Edaphobacter modestus TaxID=388466 RepID=A0A4V2G4B3_9BACT|nr:DUF302 domain-containing protein [Edaphobacter modestus]RZU40236.1 uncharacterized protein DUF302 [Edaphobacter modestus]